MPFALRLPPYGGGRGERPILTKMKYSKLIIAIIIAFIFIGTFVFLYQKSQPEPIVYNEFTTKMGDVSKTTLITGKIEPRNEVNVKPQI